MESLVTNLRNLPSFVDNRLRDLRNLDTRTRKALCDLNDEERHLFEKLTELSKEGSDFDEEPLKSSLKAILCKRQELIEDLEVQMRSIQKVYDVVDGRLSFIGSCTKDIPYVYANIAGERGVIGRRKKKRKTSAVDDLQAIELPVGDPSEPVYCICRQVSFGNMVACDSPECSYEWFHFQCVGLTEEPKDPWFCPQCKKN